MCARETLQHFVSEARKDGNYEACHFWSDQAKLAGHELYERGVSLPSASHLIPDGGTFRETVMKSASGLARDSSLAVFKNS